MTRDEAIKIVKGLFETKQTSAVTSSPNFGRPECIVDALVALRAINVDDRSPRDKFLDGLKTHGYGDGSIGLRGAIRSFDEATSHPDAATEKFSQILDAYLRGDDARGFLEDMAERGLKVEAVQ